MAGDPKQVTEIIPAKSAAGAMLRMASGRPGRALRQYAGL